MRPVELLHALEMSPATRERDIRFLRERLDTQVVWDHERGGGVPDPAQAGARARYELPGLWLSAEEIHALPTTRCIDMPEGAVPPSFRSVERGGG